jgi:hypothetical protein
MLCIVHERQLFVVPFLPKIIVAMQVKIGNQFTLVFFLVQLVASYHFKIFGRVLYYDALAE